MALDRFLETAWDAYYEQNSVSKDPDQEEMDRALGYSPSPSPLKKNSRPVSVNLPEAAYSVLTDPKNRLYPTFDSAPR
jgi:hypothetical protein